MTIVLTVLPAAAAAACAARCRPVRFRPLCEMLRSLGLVMGIVMLIWYVAIAVMVYALDAGGLLIAGGVDEARHIAESLVLLRPIPVLALFGGTWLYLTVLDRWVAAPRAELACAG